MYLALKGLIDLNLEFDISQDVNLIFPNPNSYLTSRLAGE